MMQVKRVPVLAALATCAALSAEEKPPEAVVEVTAIPVASMDQKHPGTVDFEKEILPLLKLKCIACHSQTESKADLSLETPKTILEGGKSGPAAVPGKGAESLLIRAGSHAEKPFMPPKNNKVGAETLTSEELGLIKLWIDQGAKGEVTGKGAPIQWHPLPPGVNPIYATALTPDGRVAACGRANQVFLYNVPAGRLVTRLTDPALLQSGLYKQPGVADPDGIQALAFHPGGELLASGGFRTVKLWRHEASPKRLTLTQAGAPLTALAASPDGSRLAAGTADGRVALWAVADGQPGRAIAAHTAAVTSVRFSADGAAIVSGSADGSLALWNAADSFPRHRLGAGAPVQAAAIVGTTHLIAGSSDGTVRVWAMPQEGAAAAAPVVLSGHGKAVTAIEPVPGAAPAVATASEDGTVRFWDLSAQKETRQVNHGSPVLALAVRPDGKAFASAGADKAVRLWNAENNQQIAELKGDSATRHVADLRAREAQYIAGLAGAAKNAHGESEKRLAAAQKKIAEQKAALEKLVADQAAAAAKPEAQAKSPADKEKAAKEAEAAKKKSEDDLRGAEESEKAAAAGVEQAKTVLAAADASSQAAQAALQAAQSAAAEKELPTRALAFSGDGLEIAFAGDGQAVYFASAQKGAPIETFRGHTGPVTAVVQLAGGGVATASADGSVVVWKGAAEWPLERTIGAVEDPATFSDRVTALDFSADGALVAAASGELTRSGDIKVFKVEDGSLVKAIQSAHSDEIFALELSPDGKRIASGGADKFVRVFDLETGKPVFQFEGHTHHVQGVSWRADGKIVASAGADGVIKVWSLETGEQVRTIGGFGKQVTAIDFVRFTSNTVASSGDSTVRLHNTDNGNQARVYGGASDYVYSVAVTPDGREVAAGGFSSVLHIWNGENGEALRTFGPPEVKP